jgi:hypothetical protein
MDRKKCREYINELTQSHWLFLANDRTKLTILEFRVDNSVYKILKDNNIEYILKEDWITIDMFDVVSHIRDNKINEILK